MKKIRLNLAILAAFVAVIFSSCDKDVESSAVTLNLNDSAFVTLYVFADLDLTDAGLEAAPAGTKIYTKVNYSDYRSGVAGALTKTITSDVNGMATISIPADDDGVTVSITPLPFNYEQVQEFDSYDSTINKIYTANNVSVNVSAGESKVQQINYNAPDEFNNFTEMTKISGLVLAEVVDTSAGSEELDLSFSITLHTADWSETVQVTNGTFEATVPVSSDILVTAKFQTINFVGGDHVNYEYELIGSTVGNFAVETDGVEIDFGNGVPVN